MIGECAPALAEACVRQLEGRDTEATCLRSAAVARNLLQAEGWQECPSWRAIADGARPPAVIDRGLGDWPHGWQHSASRTRNLHFRERTLLLSMPPSACAQYCAFKLGRTRVPGQPQHCPCKKLCSLPCVAVCASHSPSAQSGAAPLPDAAGSSTSSATMPWPALALGSWLGEQRSSNGRG